MRYAPVEDRLYARRKVCTISAREPHQISLQVGMSRELRASRRHVIWPERLAQCHQSDREFVR